jgi:saccharopepsin
MWRLRNLALGFVVGLKLTEAVPVENNAGELGLREAKWVYESGLRFNCRKKLMIVAQTRVLSPITVPIKIISSYYTIKLSLGTPPQPIDFLFDTGSGPLWAIDPSCAESCPFSSAYNFTRSFYDPNSSNTSEAIFQRETVEYQGDFLLDFEWSICETKGVGYKGGIIAGDIWSDKLTIQNISALSLQRVINADTSSWSSMPAGGFVGLGLRGLALGSTSIYDTLFRPSFLPDHRTGIYFGSSQNTPTNPSPATNGVVTFGGSEESTYGSEPLKWVDVLPVQADGSYAHWRVPVNGVKTNRNSVNGSTVTVLPVQMDASAILDTGAGLTSVPQSIIESLYTTLGFNYTAITHGFRPLCSEVLALNTSLTLTLGEIDITLTTADLAKPGYTADQYCWPPFNPWDSSDWLIGKNLLQSFYSVWDVGGWNVSFVGDGQPCVGLSYLKPEYKPRLSS